MWEPSFSDSFYARVNRTSSSNSIVDLSGITIYRHVPNIDVSAKDDYKDVWKKLSIQVKKYSKNISRILMFLIILDKENILEYFMENFQATNVNCWLW